PRAAKRHSASASLRRHREARAALAGPRPRARPDLTLLPGAGHNMRRPGPTRAGKEEALIGASAIRKRVNRRHFNNLKISIRLQRRGRKGGKKRDKRPRKPYGEPKACAGEAAQAVPPTPAVLRFE